VQTKESILRWHLGRAFGHLRLNRIRYAETQDFAARTIEKKRSKRRSITA